MLEKIKQIITRRKKLTIGLVLVIAVAGFIIYKRFFAFKAGLDKTTVKRGSVAEELILSGEIKAEEHAVLRFETSGQIIWVGAKESNIVKKGQLLAKLDTTSLNASYQRALSDLRSAQATVERVHDDVKDHASDETYTQKETRTTAEVAKDKAYEAVLIAERNLKGASLHAPFKGTVTSVANPFPGAFVLYSQNQFEIVNPKTIYFNVSADQTEITLMKEGQEVAITLDSFPEKEIKGTIENISFSPDLEEVGVVYKIKVSFEELETEDLKYRLGMTGDATFVMDEVKDVLYVPVQFLKTDKEDHYLLINGGKKKVYVEIGVEGEDKVEIKGDIKEDDIVYD